MNPIYKFEINANGGEWVQAFPVWKSDLSLDTEKESMQEFFRTKMNGKLLFLAADYRFISQNVFDTKFGLKLSISYDNGSAWREYWTGEFWKTDCEFSDDDQTCEVTPSPVDGYAPILDGQEKEFNLIDLAPAIEHIKADKRPMIQIYEALSSVVGCFLSGMWWEQEVTEPQYHEELVNQMHFAYIGNLRVFDITGSDEVPNLFYGDDYPSGGTKTYTSGNGTLTTYYIGGSGGHYAARLEVDGKQWQTDSSTGINGTMSPVSGTGATGVLQISTQVKYFYARIVCNVDSIQGVATYDIPEDDLVANNRNYRKCVGYTGQNMLVFTDRKTSEPTPYGIYQPGIYYARPLIPLYYGELYPCSRQTWGSISVWFRPDYLDATIEQAGRGEFTMQYTYPLGSVIKVLLAQIAPEIQFEETAEYSQFLYGERNPITAVQQRLFITPKSNVINSDYDQPAQKAPITLKQVFDMLRDCFRCYWFLDGNKLRIEHIYFFALGGSYTGGAVIGRDLTSEVETRNGKSLAYATSKYSFEKPETVGRYQFGWMDDVTELFEGYPIDIISGYVNKASIEEVTVSQFTSDIDYILLNPSEISMDGFVLLAAVESNGEYRLPYVNFILNYTDHTLQNGYVAFQFLQTYYLYDLPAKVYERNGVQGVAISTKQLMTQSINFPCFYDLDLFRKIKTNLGLGTLKKISVNLSSRQGKATLMYNAE